MPYLGQSPSKGDENNFKILDDISSYTLTFDGSDSSVVSAANDTITSLTHRFVQGQRVTYNKGGGTVIAGLSDGVYYVIKEDHNTIKLATSASNAANGIAVNITNVGGGASHTINVAFDGVNTKFKATHTNGQKAKITRSAQLVISINGVIQQPHDTATPSTGFGFDLDGTIVLSQAPVAGDVYWAHVLTNNNVTFDISDNDVDNFTGDGSTVSFNLSKTPPDNRNVLVTIDGVVQYPNDPDGTARAYTVVENVLTFVTAPASATEIQVRHIGFAGSTSGGGGSGVTNFYGRTGSVVLKNTDNIVANNAEFAGNLTVQGTMTTLDTKVTEVDQLEVAANNTTVGVAITQSGTGDILNLYDGSTERFSVADGGVTSLKATGDYQGLLINGNICPTVRFATFNDTTPLWKVGLSGNVGDTFAISDGATSGDRLTVNATHTTINGYLNTGSIALDTKIYHTGDSNNFMEFFTDQQYYATNGFERMRIHDSYLVSIGNTNISSVTQPVRLKIHGSYVNNVGPFGILEFKNRENSGNATASIRANRDAISGGNYSAGLSFHTNYTNPATASDGDYKRMVITSTGRVGIGTDTPLSGFHISDGTAYGSPQISNRKAQLIISAGSETSADIQLLSNSYNHIFFGNSSNSAAGTIVYHHTGSSTGAFQINNGGAQSFFRSSGTFDIKSADAQGNSFMQNFIVRDSGNNAQYQIGMYENNTEQLFINNHRGNVRIAHGGITNVNFAVTGGHVGIGSNFSPSRKLDVKDSTGANRIMNIRGTGTSGAFLAFLDANTTDDSKCRIGSIGGNNIGIRGDSHSFQDGGGNDKMVITSGGTVGINDSSPNTYFKLDVNGHTNIVGDIALPTTNRIYFGNSDTAFIKGEHGGSAYLAFGANNEKMRLTRSGRLGIGTDNPTAALDVRDASGSDPTFFVGHSNADVIGEAIRIGRVAPYSTIRYHSIKAEHSGGTTSNMLAFHLHNGSTTTSQTEVMRLRGDGKVLIGTNSSPDTKLQITNGTLKIETHTTFYSGSGENGENYPTIFLNADHSSGNNPAHGKITVRHSSQNTYSGDLVFMPQGYYSGSYGYQEVMRVSAYKRVGINVTPSATLHVVNNSSDSTIAQFGKTSDARYARFVNIPNQENFDHLLLSKYDNSLGELLRLQNTDASNAGQGSAIKFIGHGGNQTGKISVKNRDVNSSSNSIMELDASYVTKPNQPSFMANFGGNNNTSHNNGDYLKFNSTDHNTGNCYDTSNYKFTAPVAGNYLFYGRANMSGATTGDYARSFQVRLYKNGSSEQFHMSRSTLTGYSGSYPDTSTMVCSINLAANDYVQLKIQWEVDGQGLGSTENFHHHGSMFGGYLIG